VLAGLATGAAYAPPAAGRVVVVSLDGMGSAFLARDPVARELPTLASVRARGAQAEGLISHMPSTTANTHAALWTGTWGDVNGITANAMPLAPRTRHAASTRVSGYRSDGLRAEPLWVAAARQGVPTVALQATQLYPFTGLTAGAGLPHPPRLLHGYQAPRISSGRWLRARDLDRVSCAPGEPGALACYRWQAGPIHLAGLLRRDERGVIAMRIGQPGQARHVSAHLADAEHVPPAGRPLARHFSEGLLVDDGPGVPPVVAYFRLFDVTDNGSDLLLFQAPLQELAMYHGRVASRSEQIAVLEAAGGFVGNGSSEPWSRDGASGVPLWRGGTGLRERRYLETVELGVRQSIRHAEYAWRTYAPRLLVSYLSMPDETEHAWLGLSQADRRHVELRRWAYQLAERAAGTFANMVTPADHIVFVSDHGMAPVTHDVQVAVALRARGLVAVDASGTIDPTRSQVLHTRNCLLVHTTDWQGGVVAPRDRRGVMTAASDVLRAIADPATGQSIVTSVLASSEDRRRIGFGGANGFDLCFDTRPGYMATDRLEGDQLVVRRALPTGEHGFLPSRQDMHGILIAAGPRIAPGRAWPILRAIDVAPLVSDLLGISPPRQAVGQSPLADR